MSLVSFHRALIITAILFCFGYAAWEFRAWAAGGGGGAAAMAALFTLLGEAISEIFLIRVVAQIVERQDGD